MLISLFLNVRGEILKRRLKDIIWLMHALARILCFSNIAFVVVSLACMNCKIVDEPEANCYVRDPVFILESSILFWRPAVREAL